MKRRKRQPKPRRERTPLHVEIPNDVRQALVNGANANNRTLKGELVETLQIAYGLKRETQPEPELAGVQ